MTRTVLCSICGAILLGMVHIIIVYIVVHFQGHNALLGRIALYRGPAGIFWGLIFGATLSLAHRNFAQGKWLTARRLLQRTGAFSALIQIGFVAYVAYHFNATRLLPSPAPTLGSGRFLLAYIWGETLSNICVQAALLMLLAGWLLPRNTEHTVQVTENLRL